MLLSQRCHSPPCCGGREPGSRRRFAAEHVLHGVADNRKQEGVCKRLLLEFTNRFKTDAGEKRNTGLPAYNGRITMTLEQR
jgi:hypothetical protein